MSAVHHTTERTFSFDVLQSPVPVLIDFYADWCGPCRTLAPTLSRLAAEFSGRVRILKVNVDEDPDLAERYRVESIPTLLFVSAGQVVGRSSGLIGEAALRQALLQLLDMSTTA